MKGAGLPELHHFDHRPDPPWVLAHRPASTTPDSVRPRRRGSAVERPVPSFDLVHVPALMLVGSPRVAVSVLAGTHLRVVPGIRMASAPRPRDMNDVAVRRRRGVPVDEDPESPAGTAEARDPHTRDRCDWNRVPENAGLARSALLSTPSSTHSGTCALAEAHLPSTCITISKGTVLDSALRRLFGQAAQPRGRKASVYRQLLVTPAIRERKIGLADPQSCAVEWSPF